jgi:hypothetical protein
MSLVFEQVPVDGADEVLIDSSPWKSIGEEITYSHWIHLSPPVPPSSLPPRRLR